MVTVEQIRAAAKSTIPAIQKAVAELSDKMPDREFPLTLPETSPRPEFLTCNEGYVIYKDGRLSPQTVQLYDESGKLLAIIPGVHTLHVAPLRR